MEETMLISYMATLVILAAFLSIVMSRLRFPALIGFLTAGIVIANFMKLSEEGESVVEIFSNIGLIMLMFSIGMEIDVRKLKDQGRFALVVALVQLPLMVVGGTVVGILLGFNMLQSICLGAIISGSSTAVVMAVLKSQGKLDREHIETLVLIVIMEDIGQVIMLSILTPMLQGSEMSGEALALLIVQIAIFMIACFTLGLMLLPRIINWFYKRSNDELISLLCIGATFALALAASKMGLSVAIGAFLMGVIVGTTRPKEAVEHFVDPLKSLFMAMFFISVGMEVSLGSLSQNIILAFIIFTAFAVFKTASVYLGYWIGNEGGRNGFVAAVGLCAMGEFAFIISKQALDYGVVDQSFYSAVIGAALISMIALPILSKYSDKAYDGAVNHCPKPVQSVIHSLNMLRDGFYSILGQLSSRTADLFRRGVTTIYFNVILMAIVVVVFYHIYDPLSWWLDNKTGMGDHWARVLIMTANLLVLLFPALKIMDNIRLVMYIISSGKKKRDSSIVDDDMKKFYSSINPLILAGIVSIVIVILTPNKLDTISHIVVGIIAIIALSAYQYWRIKMHRKKQTTSKSFEDIEI